MAQLDLAQAQGKSSLINYLANNGMLQSGGLNAGEKALFKAWQDASATGASNLLSALAGFNSTYATTWEELQQRKADAARQAALDAARMFPPTYTPPTEATDPTTTTTWGTGPENPLGLPPYTGGLLPPAPVPESSVPANYPGDLYWNPNTGMVQTQQPVNVGVNWGV